MKRIYVAASECLNIPISRIILYFPNGNIVHKNSPLTNIHFDQHDTLTFKVEESSLDLNESSSNDSFFIQIPQSNRHEYDFSNHTKFLKKLSQDEYVKALKNSIPMNIEESDIIYQILSLIESDFNIFDSYLYECNPQKIFQSLNFENTRHNLPLLLYSFANV